MIEITTIEGGTVTEFRVVGGTSFVEVTETIEHHYASVGEAILWDISGGTLLSLESSHIKRIAAQVARLRSGGFTAYVGPVDAEFGLLRMYETLAELGGARHDLGVFRSREEALAWLRERLADGGEE